MGFRFFNTEGAQKSNTVSSVDLPAGTVMDFAGAAAPTGWTVCDGSAISRTTFSALFSVVGTTYGVGDGSTTFNVPDARGRVAVGPDSAAGRVSTNNTLAAVSGLQNHTLAAVESGVAAHPHTVGTLVNAAELAHTHSGTSGGISVNHQHGPSNQTTDAPGDHLHMSQANGNFLSGGQTGVTDSNVAGNFYASASYPHNAAGNHAHTVVAGNTGFVSADHTHTTTVGAGTSHNHAISGSVANSTAAAAASAHNNMQPYIVLNKIIKT